MAAGYRIEWHKG